MDGFEKNFLPGYLSKHFHAVAVNRTTLSSEVLSDDAALILYANHASWWDPLVAMFVHRRLMKRHRLYAPMDASALKRYRIFNRMGFYGIEQNSHRGAVEFLHRSLQILRQPAATVALTPEGTFRDVRDRRGELMPGLAHLAHAVESTQPPASERSASRCVWMVPVALEYCYWEERLPECLCWFGEPLCTHWGLQTASKPQWQQVLVSRLRAAQDDLAAASIARDETKFEMLLSGRTGTSRIYDAARRAFSRWRGQPVQLSHGEKLSGRRSQR